MTYPLLEARDISRTFSPHEDLIGKVVRTALRQPIPAHVRALSNVSLALHTGEVLGVVGESGCGKSTLGRILAGILQPSSGSLAFQGTPFSAMDPLTRASTFLKIQMIFQDPMSSLNPRKRVSDLIAEAPLVHGLLDPKDRDRFVHDALTRVGLDPQTQSRFPHQFSGGQRQRINIARALAVNPEILICDESVAALDVSIQAQILNVFMALKEQGDLSFVFISHDLGVVEHLCDRVAILYLGQIVEVGTVDALFQAPQHPYTQALLKEIPRIGAGKRRFNPIRGEIPSPLSPPSGCPFHPRCPHSTPECTQRMPGLQEVGHEHLAACHLLHGTPSHSLTELSK
ncbi:MAG: ATP-binding cassette domain-containing protein [Gammaproteobacteria bacterium]|nr:ATP-binding cassette domain-containing protein [Gammaproteobacteria bacterium]